MTAKIPCNVPEAHAQVSTNIPYSVFSKPQERCIVLLIAFASMFSPLSSFIYYPAIDPLSRDLHTSIESINLSITSYMIASGIVPSFLGGFADQVGRRPVYIFAFVVYLAANVGLALQGSFAALIGLRVLQSVGSSGDNFASDSFLAVVNVLYCC